ncbi:MAG TPA: porin family protein [Chitinophagaceae bacterium]|jgi:hypothetical protein|nr:porin family protein [Chitinophagaceae bacterium]
MRKPIFRLTFILLALMAAGDSFAQTSFGIKAGPDLANLTTKIGGAKGSSNAIIGVAGGVYANLPVAPMLEVQPSLLYEGKGEVQSVQGYNIRTRLNYLTLPVDLLYTAEMAGGGGWMIGVGPYLGYGISGKVSGGPQGSYGGNPFKADEGSLKRLDAGGHIQLGYEMANGFNIGLNAELGLMNLARHGDKKNSIKNTSFGLMLGYVFGKY